MTLKDYKDRTEALRQQWHKERNLQDELSRKAKDAWDELNRQTTQVDAAHLAYRDEKARYRIAKEFGITDPQEVAMLAKLRNK